METASGVVLVGASYSKVRLLVCIKGRTRSIILTDVLHIPQISRNLISIARLQDKGIVVETTAPPAKNALVIKDQGKIVGIASRVKNSYVLCTPTDMAFPVRQVTGLDDAMSIEYARWH